MILSLISEKLDTEKVYSIAEAIEIMQSVKSEKFEESVDISVRLGVDPTKSDQNVRGAVTLPNSLGKEVSVAVFADGDQADAAKKAGADHIGMDEFGGNVDSLSLTLVVDAFGKSFIYRLWMLHTFYESENWLRMKK